MYNKAIIFYKQGNLLSWLQHQDNIQVNARTTEMYSRPKAIRLILLVRYDSKGTHCKIKCPVNPLPLKGEFTVVNESLICKLLIDNGWIKTETIPMGLLT